MATMHGMYEALWLRNLVKEVFQPFDTRHLDRAQQGPPVLVPLAHETPQLTSGIALFGVAFTQGEA